MDDVRVLKAADDVDDRVDVPDVLQKFVAEALALGGAFDKPRDVDELEGRRGELLGVVHFGQLVKPLVRHRHDPDVGLDGAEGVVGRFRPGVGQGVEKGALPDVGKAHHA